MNVEKTRDGIPVSELATRFREDGRPLCPQFRPCDMEGLYPVQGHCVLSRRPGWFMIPGIEEYSRYCTSAGFAQCCWFGGVGEPTGSVADDRGEQRPRKEAKSPADVGEPWIRESA